MARKVVKLWYEPEADYLEVQCERKAGYFRETTSPQVMEKVDDHGNIRAPNGKTMRRSGSGLGAGGSGRSGPQPGTLSPEPRIILIGALSQ